MTFDLVLRDARLAGAAGGPIDIGICNGRIAAMAPNLPAGRHNDSAGNNLVVPGLVETHIHLDKTCILDRCTICEGSLTEAIRETARAKRAFTEDDIYQRARRTLEKAIAEFVSGPIGVNRRFAPSAHDHIKPLAIQEIDERRGLGRVVGSITIGHHIDIGIDRGEGTPDGIPLALRLLR